MFSVYSCVKDVVTREALNVLIVAEVAMNLQAPTCHRTPNFSGSVTVSSGQRLWRDCRQEEQGDSGVTPS